MNNPFVDEKELRTLHITLASMVLMLILAGILSITVFTFRNNQQSSNTTLTQAGGLGNPSGLSLSQATTNIILYQSTTKKVFDLQALQAASFQFFSLPIIDGSGLSWFPGFGSIPSGGSIPIYLQASSDSIPGFYSGTGLVKNIQNNNILTIPLQIEILDQALGIYVNPPGISHITLTQSSITQGFTITANALTQFKISTTNCGGIQITPSQFTLTPGQSVTTSIEDISQTPIGMYECHALITNIFNKKSLDVPLYIAVVSPSFAISINPLEPIHATIVAGSSTQVSSLSATKTAAFLLQNDPIAQIGIHWVSTNGGIAANTSIPLTLHADTSVSTGSYSGMTTIQNTISGTRFSIPIELDVVSSNFHMEKSPAGPINISLHPGEQVKAFDIISNGAKEYQLSTSSLPSFLHLSSMQGSLIQQSGQEIEILADGTGKPGIYTFSLSLMNGQNSASLTFPVNVTIL